MIEHQSSKGIFETLDNRSSRSGVRRIVHLTSVHPFNDIRIFLKECGALAAAGYETHLVAPGAPAGMQRGVHLHATNKTYRRRFARMTGTVYSVYREALAINADLYHFHDPELIPVGLLLRARGKPIVYDIHEDLPRDILSKAYLGWIRRPLSLPVEYLENIAARRFSALVAATPTIGARFRLVNRNTIVINNYPLLKEMMPPGSMKWTARDCAVAYIGNIILDRGIMEMVEAMRYVPSGLAAVLELAGAFYPPEVRGRAMGVPGWASVHECGLLSRTQVAQLLGRVRAGLILSHPVPNHLRSQPNKMFEYMSAGIPVIASDFPLWREQIEAIGCGLLVDPLDPHAIACAIEYVLTHSNEAEAMGRRGREAVEKFYNWEAEKTKLLKLYGDLLN